MELWTVDLRFGVSLSEDEWACFQSKLETQGRVPIHGYGEPYTAGTAQLPMVKAFSRDQAGRLALDLVRSAADACNVVIDPTITSVYPRAKPLP